MIILPAIDIREGKVVRLLKGDYDRMEVYSQEPQKIAAGFAESGAEWMHIIDLDGAKDGELVNFGTISALIDSCGLNCQIGGGIRSYERIDKYLSAGASRVILGTKATSAEFLTGAIERFGDKIAVGVDAKDQRVAIGGWIEVTDIDSVEFCGMLAETGVSTIIYTDISKDGAMQGTNIDIYRRLKKEIDVKIIASGGISSIDELDILRGIGVYGAILGKSLYTGAIELKSALARART
ncbi:MAG: 1-(5-phosphoribosyl)-5-[(5-phosphoribosylamino)methylideneamino]imidazole-4-carboxamide isomerase [Oscillospiraceae bacterium]|nr:1-(5-phosphoribosyl)-5-[(5-phosphoribosylamino)methylideneamino]imidazole-4-carboxamide isomerase [Oscillospiraceae bacterium]